MKLKVAITGANGFVGTNLCKRLSQHLDVDIFALVRPGGKVNYLNDFRFDGEGQQLFPLIESDLRSDESVAAALRGMDVLIHLSGLVSDWGKREDFMNLNVEGTRRVLRGATAGGVKRVIFLSSLTVHAMDGHSYDDETCPTNMTEFPYGESKRLAEDLVLAWNDESLDRRGIVVRPGWVIYGPYDRNTFVGVLEAIDKGYFGFVDGGKKLTSYVYSENLCSGLERLVTAEAEGIYNIIDGNMSWKKWVVLWSKALNKATPKMSFPHWFLYPFVTLLEALFLLFCSPNPPALTRYRIKIMHGDLAFTGQRITHLGHKPEGTFEESVEKTLHFYHLSKK